MRLNRVLQMTAAIGMTVAATIFTISCGEDGADGNPGKGCTVTGTGVPYTVVCNGQTVGELNNGADGVSPGQAPDGATGDKGKSCSVSTNEDGISLTLTCGGEVQGNLDGCRANNEGGHETTVTCTNSQGGTTFGLCDAVIFDPSKQFCSEGTTASVVDFSDYVCGLDLDRNYNPQKEYCGYANEQAFKSKIPSVLPLCASKIPFTGSLTGANKPNEAVYDETNKEWGARPDGTYSETAGSIAGGYGTSAGSLWDPTSSTKGYGDTWLGEYCQVTRTVAFADLAKTQDKITNFETKTKAPTASYDSKCNGVFAEINKDTYQGQYCGYLTANSASKAVITGACGDGSEPNATKFGEGYCWMKDKADKWSTKYSAAATNNTLCGTLPVRSVNKITALDSNDWVNEYYGFATRADALESTPVKSIIKNAMCDSVPTGGSPAFKPANYGPNATAWKAEYCQAGRDNKTKLVTLNGVTSIGNFAKVYCLASVDTSTNAITDSVAAITTGKLNSAPTTAAEVNPDNLKTLNEKIWQNQYCGYDAVPASGNVYTLAVKEGVCDDGKGPNDIAYTKGWENQYCQAISKANPKTQVVGVDATASATIGALNAVYCIAGTGTIVTDATSAKTLGESARINAGEWKNEYCGYASKEAAVANPRQPTVITGRCDYTEACADGSTSCTAATVGPNASTQAGWRNEYCQAFKNGKTKIVGIGTTASGLDLAVATAQSSVATPASGSGLGFADAVKVYCLADTVDATNAVGATTPAVSNKRTTYLYADAVASARINENTWKKQYCGYQSQLALEKTTPDATTPTTLYKTAEFYPLESLCDDGTKPNAAGVGDVWKNQFCTARSRTGLTTISDNGDFCFATGGTSTVTLQTATSEYRLNENGWKGEYCFADQKKGVCTGGYTPIANANSTDAVKCKE